MMFSIAPHLVDGAIGVGTEGQRLARATRMTGNGNAQCYKRETVLAPERRSNVRMALALPVVWLYDTKPTRARSMEGSWGWEEEEGRGQVLEAAVVMLAKVKSLITRQECVTPRPVTTCTRHSVGVAKYPSHTHWCRLESVCSLRLIVHPRASSSTELTVRTSPDL